MKKVFIVLENGRVFEGKRFGADGECTGELVFTTGMDAYMETLTDPSYFGQIVIQTFPLIGNYGSIPDDAESRKPFACGYIVREQCETPSNFRSEGTLDQYLKDTGIIGVYDVDTRELTQIIRQHGTMNARITEVPEGIDMDDIKNYEVKSAVEAVTTAKNYCIKADQEKYRVALMDYGVQKSIISELTGRGCTVTVFPAGTSAEEVLNTEPDGIVLSGGPGDPGTNTSCIEEIKKMIGKSPIFGVGLGHQLLALAAGGKTERLRHGHRGANQPIKSLTDGKTFISAQNHSYTVRCDSIEKAGGRLTFVNANDSTCEGIDYPKKSAFSVQFYPKLCCSSKDTRLLFDNFISMMGGKDNASE